MTWLNKILGKSCVCANRERDNLILYSSIELVGFQLVDTSQFTYEM